MISDEDIIKNMTTGQWSPAPTFKTRIKSAAEQGLLLFIKYSLVALLLYAALNYFNTLVAGANNGTNAILYLNEAISKGYLPKTVQGQLPPKQLENPNAQVK